MKKNCIKREHTKISKDQYLSEHINKINSPLVSLKRKMCT